MLDGKYTFSAQDQFNKILSEKRVRGTFNRISLLNEPQDILDKNDMQEPYSQMARDRNENYDTAASSSCRIANIKGVSGES